MALTGPQKVTVAEITYETYAKIDGLASSLNSDQETSIVADIATWNEIRNKPHIRLKGGRDGEDLNYDRLLEAITIRVRGAFGLPPLPPALCPLGDVFAGGISRSDADARNADSDRPRSVFTTDLHSVC